MTDKTENIRVFVRVRPPFSTELQKESVSVTGDRAVKLKYDRYEASCKYNRVFDQASSQQEVFGQITPLLLDTLDGVNCSVLAYGQTSAGKARLTQPLCAVLCCAVLCCVMLCCAVLCCAMLLV
jgi:hypothetical protein